MPRHLPVLRGFPPPSGPGEALYVAPGPAREGRACGNCALWRPPLRCIIHPPSVPVRGSQVCGYHVLGTPLPPARPGTSDSFPLTISEYVTPEASGLVDAPYGGTRCGNCSWFGRDSHCHRVGTVVDPSLELWTPTLVDFDGCCAEWSPR